MAALNRFVCDAPDCGISFSRRWNLTRHKERYHNNEFSENCLLCQENFTSSRQLQEHLIADHGPSERFLLKSSAFGQTVVKYRLTYDENELDFKNAQIKIFNEIRETIVFEAAQKTVVKVSLIYICQMSMQNLEGERQQISLIPFRSSNFVSNGLRGSNLSNNIRNAFRQQENSMEEFCESGSNWRFDRAVAFDIEISAIRPLVVGAPGPSGSPIFFDCDVKKELKRMCKHLKYLYDPQNTNEECFLYCVHHLLKESRSYKKWKSTLNLDKISFPISILGIKKFVLQNTQLDIRINILYRNLRQCVFPYECGIGCGSQVVTLLMTQMTNEMDNEISINRHFLGVTDVNRYLATRYVNPKTGKSSYTNQKYCLNCLFKFRNKHLLKEHELLCHTKKPVSQAVHAHHWIYFKNTHYQHMQEYIGFIDFECLLHPNISNQKCPDCQRIRCKCDKSFTEVINHQEPFAYSFVIVNKENQIIHERTYVGEDAAPDLIDHLKGCWTNWLKDLLNINKKMIFTKLDLEKYESAEDCYLCGESFIANHLRKNRDHNHYTGEFLGAACTKCNFKRRKPKRLPIFLHNGSKYDFHFIVRALNEKKVGKIKVLPYNGEHFRTIEFLGYKFLDSLAFLQGSLDQLSGDLSKASHDYPILKQTSLVKTDNEFDQVKFELLLKKSYYPYEFCTDMEVMESTTKIPKLKDFYSSLREETIDKSEYQIAKKVWDVFDCEDMIDYTKIYCKLDTILLAEIFQKFRKDMFQFSNLDPSHYISLPSFAFDSMTKLTKCELQCLNDINMVHLIESGIRGGVSFVSHRYLEASEKENNEIVYIDANNLYGLAQMAKLPYDNFAWLSKEDISKIDWKTVDHDAEYGYILEVDLLYPSKLHKLHRDFPLAPENMTVEFKDLSPLMKEIFLELEKKDKYKDRKLVGTFNKRKRYVIHFQNLKLYLQLGMKLTKIHRAITFRQSNFIAPFISKCTQRRQQAISKFEQDQFKKLANCVYGKTIQNTRNYMSVKLHTKEKSYLKAVSNITFKNFSILGENLVQTNHSPDFITHDRPITVGFAILELSKHFMYDFYYNKLLKGLDCNVELGMSDTDSFLFKVDDSDTFRKHIHPYMDYSNYPSTHPLYNLKNKSKLGFFKDELASQFECKEFVGLKAKCYALKLVNKDSQCIKEKKVCKGLGRVAINNRLRFKHYKQSLFKGIPRRYDFNVIRSHKHKISTKRISKKAISHFDSKRWIYHCGIHSDPYGSTLIDPHRSLYCPKC